MSVDYLDEALKKRRRGGATNSAPSVPSYSALDPTGKIYGTRDSSYSSSPYNSSDMDYLDIALSRNKPKYNYTSTHPLGIVNEQAERQRIFDYQQQKNGLQHTGLNDDLSKNQVTPSGNRGNGIHGGGASFSPEASTTKPDEYLLQAQNDLNYKVNPGQMPTNERNQRIQEVQNEIESLKKEYDSIPGGEYHIPGSTHIGTPETENRKREISTQLGELRHELDALQSGYSYQKSESEIQREKDNAKLAKAEKATTLEGLLQYEGNLGDKLKSAWEDSTSVWRDGKSSTASTDAYKYYYDKKASTKFEANYTVNKLSLQSSEAFTDYLMNPTEGNLRYAQTLKALSNQYRQNNSELLNRDDGVGNLITEDLAGYLPQFTEQAMLQAVTTLAGGGLGYFVGGANGAEKGMKAGRLVGAAGYSMYTTTGSAFSNLLDQGVDEETARKAATDEAVLSTIIECADEVVDMFTTGFGKAGSAIFGTPVKGFDAVLKKFVGSSTWKKWAVRLGKYGLNIASEANEEGSQEAISIANENLRKQGKEVSITELALEALKVYFDAIFNRDSENRERIGEAAGGGARLALLDAPVQSAGNAALSAGASTFNGQQIRNSGQMNETINEGLDSDPNSQAYHIAQQLQQNQNRKPGNRLQEIARQMQQDYQLGQLSAENQANEASALEAYQLVGSAAQKSVAGEKVTNTEVAAILDNDIAVQALEETTGQEISALKKSQQPKAVRNALNELSKDLGTADNSRYVPVPGSEEAIRAEQAKQNVEDNHVAPSKTAVEDIVREMFAKEQKEAPSNTSETLNNGETVQQEITNTSKNEGDEWMEMPELTPEEMAMSNKEFEIHLLDKIFGDDKSESTAEAQKTAVPGTSAFQADSNTATSNNVSNRANSIDNGQSVRPSTKLSVDAQNFVENAVDMGDTGKAAILDLYDGQSNEIDYVTDMMQYYYAGRNSAETGMTYEDVKGTSGAINKYQAQMAFTYGQVDQERENKAIAKQNRKANTNNTKEVSTNGTGEHVSDEVTQRNDGKSSGVKTDRVAETPERVNGRGSESTEAETRKAERNAILKRSGSVRASSIIEGGSKTQTVEIINQKTSTDKDVQRAREIYRKQGISDDRVVFFKGGELEVTRVGVSEDGTPVKVTHNVRGFYDQKTKTIYAQVDNATFSVESITAHETVHDLVRRGKLNVSQIRGYVRENNRALYDLMTDIYKEQYPLLNSLDMVWEEVIADSLADLNTFKGNIGESAKLDNFIRALGRKYEQVADMIEQFTGMGRDELLNNGTVETEAKTVQKKTAQSEVERGPNGRVYDVDGQLYVVDSAADYGDSNTKGVLRPLIVPVSEIPDGVKRMLAATPDDIGKFPYFKVDNGKRAAKEVDFAKDFDLLSKKFIGKYDANSGTIGENKGRVPILPGDLPMWPPDPRFVRNIKYSASAASLTEYEQKKALKDGKNLIAVHNTSAEKLLRTLDLEGIPMPSIAITLDETPQTSFGDYSLIMKRDTIDPQKHQNTNAYTADIYSPRFPRIDYEADPDVVSRISKKFYDMQNKYGRNVARGLQNFADTGNAADVIRSWIADYGSIENAVEQIAYNTNDTSLMQAFLADTAKPVEDVVATETKRMPDYYAGLAEHLSKELKQSTIDDLLDRNNNGYPEYRKNENGDPIESGNMNKGEMWFYSKHGAEYDKAVLDYVKNHDVKILKSLFTNSQSARANFLDQLETYLKNGGPEYQASYVDREATEKAIIDAVDRKEFAKWMHDLFDGLKKSEGIYNGKDIYTASGNRRSFAALHNPVTAQNIVNAMKADGVVGSENFLGMIGFGQVRAALSKNLKSFTEMHKQSNLLQKADVSFEENEANAKALSDRLLDVREDLESFFTEKLGYGESTYDAAWDALFNAASKKNISKNAIMTSLKRDGFNVSDELAGRIHDVFVDIQNMNTHYFEAKPTRVVGFDEVASAVVPDDISPVLEKKLKDNGIDVVKYMTNNNEDRWNKVLELSDTRNDVRFSSTVNHVEELTEEELANWNKDKKDDNGNKRDLIAFVPVHSGSTINNAVRDIDFVVQQTGKSFENNNSFSNHLDEAQYFLMIRGDAVNPDVNSNSEIIDMADTRFYYNSNGQTRSTDINRDPERYLPHRLTKQEEIDEYFNRQRYEEIEKKIKNGESLTQEDIDFVFEGDDGYSSFPDGGVDDAEIGATLPGVISRGGEFVPREGTSSMYHGLFASNLLYTSGLDTVSSTLANRMTSRDELREQEQRLKNHSKRVDMTLYSNSRESFAQYKNNYHVDDYVHDMLYAMTTENVTLDNINAALVAYDRDATDETNAHKISKAFGGIYSTQYVRSYILPQINKIVSAPVSFFSGKLRQFTGNSSDIFYAAVVRNHSFIPWVPDLGLPVYVLGDGGMRNLGALRSAVANKYGQKFSAAPRDIQDTVLRQVENDLSDELKYTDDVNVSSDVKDLQNELKKQKKTADFYKKQIHTTDAAQRLRSGIEARARKLLKEYGSGYDHTKLSDRLEEYVNNTQAGLARMATMDQEAQNRFIGRAKEDASKIMRDVITESKELKNPEAVEQRSELIRTLKQGFYVNEYDLHDIPDYQTWLQRNRLRMGITTDRTKGKGGLDTLWSELQDEFGRDMFPDEIDTVSDQLMHLEYLLDEQLVPTYVSAANTSSFAEAVHYGAESLFGEVVADGIKAAKPTYADRMYEKVKEAQSEAKRMVAQTKKIEAQKSINAIEAYKEQMREKAALKSSRQKKLYKTKQQLLKYQERLAEKKNWTPVSQEWMKEKVSWMYDTMVNLTGERLTSYNDLVRWLENNSNLGVEPDTIAILNQMAAKQTDGMKFNVNGNLTYAEMRQLTQAIANIATQIDNYDKLLRFQGAERLAEAGRQTIEDVRDTKGYERKGKKADQKEAMHALATFNNLTPEAFVNHITRGHVNSPLRQIIKDLQMGELRSRDYTMHTDQMFAPWFNSKEYMQHLGEDVVFTGHDYKGDAVKVKMTKGNMISLYLASFDKDNMKHISGDGITFPDYELYKSGNPNSAYSKGTRVIMSAEEVNAFCKKNMTEQDLRFAKQCTRYFEYAKNAINEVSDEVVGYHLAMVEDYFPIIVDPNFLSTDFATINNDGSISGLGELKERVQSTKPIISYNIVDVIRRHTQNISRYYGLAIPVRNAQKLWGFGVRVANENGTAPVDTTLKAIVDDKWGKQAVDYFEGLMRNIQSTDHKTLTDRALLKIRHNYTGAVLKNNISVGLSQAASYFTGMSELGVGPVLKALGKPVKVNPEIINKYTSVYYDRTQGYINPEYGDYISKKRKEAPLSPPDKLDLSMQSDLLTTRRLWLASEYYVRENQPDLKIGSDEYYKAVADKYIPTILKTQQNYFVSTRSPLLRSGAFGTSFFMFMNEQQQKFSLMYDVVGEYRSALNQVKANRTAENVQIFEAAKKKLSNTMIGITLSNVAFSLIKVFVNALRGKYKNDDDGFESAAKTFGEMMIDSLAGMLPLGSEIASIINSIATGERYYGYSNVIVDAIGDLGTALVSAAGKNTKNRPYRIIKAAEALATFLGIPLQNVMNLISIPVTWFGPKDSDGNRPESVEKWISSLFD